jgi:hypothetical protein
MAKVGLRCIWSEIRLDTSNSEYITNHYLQNACKFHLTSSQNLPRHYLSLIQSMVGKCLAKRME